MKLRDKWADVLFQAREPSTGHIEAFHPGDYLTRRQERKMARRPYMVRQFAHHLKRELEAEGWQDPEIRARVRVSLNGREPQLLVDPDVDLAAQPHSWWKADWILPLEKPLPHRPDYLDY